MNSILNYYPCGAYKLTKDGNMLRYKKDNNLSKQGASNKSLDQLYNKGYIESYMNMGDNSIYYIILIIFLFILIKKKCIYII